MQGLSPLHNGFTKAFAFVIVPAALRAALCLQAQPGGGAAFFFAEKSCIFYKYGVYKCQPI